jgi:hypothetical protein
MALFATWRRTRWAGYAVRMGDVRNSRRIMTGKLERKIPFQTPRRRWEDNIRMNLKGKEGRMWTGFIWLRTGSIGGLF